MRTRALLLLCLGLLGGLLAACQHNDEFMPADGPPPISGGTLEVTQDGDLAILSDPARASIFLVDLRQQEEIARLVLRSEDEPGRIVEDNRGRIHVVLRRAGDVITLERERGTMLYRRAVCAAPRGIAVDGPELVVACAEGELVRMPAADGPITERIKLDPDLRDVVVLPSGRLMVSRFRSAEVLLIEGREVLSRMRPPSANNFGGDMEPTVAWRLRAHPEGALMVHQHSRASQLGRLGFSGGVYYGGGCDVGVVHPSVTIFTESGPDRTATLEGASLVVDGVDAGRGSLYLAAAAEPSAPREGGSVGVPSSGIRQIPSDFFDLPTGRGSCVAGQSPIDRYTPVTAVAALPGGGYVAQLRDPGRLWFSRNGEGGTTIDLSGGRVQHMGHMVFHEAAGTGATCASCHPEGGDDGHLWLFDLGARRTQSLNGGILETAPFHWAGDVGDTGEVMQGTFVGRMGGGRLFSDEMAAFNQWIDALPTVPGPSEEASAVARGESVFEDSGCASCHSGAQRTNNESVDVGTGGTFQVPSLQEMVYRSSYLHDASAPTLEELIERHGEAAARSEAERRDLVTFLRSL